jgi:hypothetical protein
MIIQYSTSVYTPAGWRDVSITAEANPSASGKMATVERVLAIDGEKPAGTMSRTGAKRQQFHGTAIASREVGKRKRLSACRVLAYAAA